MLLDPDPYSLYGSAIQNSQMNADPGGSGSGSTAVEITVYGTYCAGRDITEYLIKLLLLRGYAFNHTADFETVRCVPISYESSVTYSNKGMLCC
jgi:hypothetical protein